MKQSEFLQGVQSPDLAKAVIRQFGGWSAFTENAPDVARHGIDGGYSGFTRYSDTVKFAEAPATRRLIIAELEELACQLGEDVVAMVSNFGVFRSGGIDQDDKRDLYRYLSQTKCKGHTIPNLMAWFAAEEICRAYDDMV